MKSQNKWQNIAKPKSISLSKISKILYTSFIFDIESLIQ